MDSPTALAVPHAGPPLPSARRSMFAWWGIFPAMIMFSVVTLFFAAAMAQEAGKQQSAQNTATGPTTNPTTAPVVISEATAGRLEFLPQPVALFGGEVMVNYPALIEPFNMAPGAQKYAVGMWDRSHKSTDFAAMFQLVPLLKGDSLAAHADRLGRLTQEKSKLTETFQWHPLHGHCVGTITQAVVGQPNPRVNRIMWAIVQLDEKRLIVINYSIWAQAPEDRAAYEAAAQKIAESVSAGSK